MRIVAIFYVSISRDSESQLFESRESGGVLDLFTGVVQVVKICYGIVGVPGVPVKNLKKWHKIC